MHDGVECASISLLFKPPAYTHAHARNPARIYYVLEHTRGDAREILGAELHLGVTRGEVGAEEEEAGVEHLILLVWLGG